MAAWYEKPYPKGAAVGPPKLPRVLTPPQEGESVVGEDVLAMKRIVSHAQRWLPWEPTSWDRVYNVRFSMGKGTGNVADSGVRGFQRQENLPQTGIVDDATYQRMRRARIPTGPREGAPILDTEAARLIRLAVEEFSDDAKLRRVRVAIADFMRRAEAVEYLWHYTQRRPFTGLGRPPEEVHYGDCSAYAVLAYYWARKETGILVPDPSGYRYTGYGNTWDDLDGHPRVESGNYLVGDFAHFNGHMMICRQPGTGQTARWSSFGSEGGPDDLGLYYRPDFRFVCRPRLLPA